MKITNIRSERKGNSISLLADCKIRPVGWDSIYFSLDQRYAGCLYEDASPFAAGLLVPCMILGEDLIIDGAISTALYEGMHRIMDIMAGWNVGLKHIKIEARQIVKDKVYDTAKPRLVGAYFSAGVDSFYTYLKHANDTTDRISHFILIRGNDIALDNRELWETTRDKIQSIADQGKVELVVVESNLQELLEPMMSPDFTHGGGLAAVGLCLRACFSKIYIASTFDEAHQLPWGSHLDTDRLWSTETITFVHDGTEASRFQKIERQIAHSPMALENLRVCYMDWNRAYNCGRCEKCIRTMLELYIVGKLKDAKTFPSELDLRRVTDVAAHSGVKVFVYKDILARLKERGLDVPLQKAIEKGMVHVTEPTAGMKDRIFKTFLYYDHRYLRGKLHKLYKLIRW